MAEQILIVDGSSLIYRSFYAIPRLTNSKGLQTNAIQGYCNILIKLLNKYKPKYMCVVFDAAKKSFRNEIYKEYKANREKMPEGLAEQIPYIKTITPLLGIHSIEDEGLEADDIIASVAKKYSDSYNVNIVTSDKDLFQLITKESGRNETPGVIVLDEHKGKRIGIKEVRERFGVGPEKIKELLALMGDKTDNVPGIPGVGEKTASKLLQQFNSIERLVSNTEKLKNEKLREKIIQNKELLKISLKLIELRSDNNIKIDLSNLTNDKINDTEVAIIFNELEFHTLAKRLGLDGPPSATKTTGSTLKSVTPSDFLNNKQSAEVYIVNLEGTNYYSSNNIYTKEDNEIIKWALNSETTTKFTYDVSIISRQLEEEVRNTVVDMQLASFLLDPDYRHDSIDSSYRKLTGEKITPEVPSAINALIYLKENLWDKMEDSDKKHLLSIEMPVSFILQKMSDHGMLVDSEKLSDLSKKLSGKIDGLTQRIYKQTGCEFNLDSPKQLQEVLFNKLKLNPVKKTKTGYSTDVSVLQELSTIHAVPELLLEYRTLAKLKSGFVDSLLKKIKRKTNKIHTRFNQAGSATGRIITTDPNLQNLPVKGDFSDEIRGCFIAPDDFNILTADYSQIELRILAHLTDDKSLVRAFKNGDDIHTLTATEIFDVTAKLVTPELRRKAKEVNFSIIYGITPFGLSQRLRIPRNTAKQYIDKYFKQYPGVKNYIDTTLKRARKEGHVTTLLKRKRLIPDLTSRNNVVRQHAERVAINSPIQGSASDILKLAMIKIDAGIKQFNSHLLMQIHDEIVIEVDTKYIEELTNYTKNCMESCISLKVPLTVEIKRAPRWTK